MKSLKSKMLHAAENYMDAVYGLSIDDFYSVTIRSSGVPEVCLQGDEKLIEHQDGFDTSGIYPTKIIPTHIKVRNKVIYFKIEIVLT